MVIIVVIIIMIITTIIITHPKAPQGKIAATGLSLLPVHGGDAQISGLEGKLIGYY